MRASAIVPGERRTRYVAQWGAQPVTPVKLDGRFYEFVWMQGTVVREFEWREVPYGSWKRCAVADYEAQGAEACVRFALAHPQRSHPGCEEIGVPA